MKVVYAQNGLVSYQSVLESPFVYLPHDAVVPGALTAGDLCDVARALAPRPLRIETPVDGLNRRASAETLSNAYQSTSVRYGAFPSKKRLRCSPSLRTMYAGWLIEALKAK